MMFSNRIHEFVYGRKNEERAVRIAPSINISISWQCNVKHLSRKRVQLLRHRSVVGAGVLTTMFIFHVGDHNIQSNRVVEVNNSDTMIMLLIITIWSIKQSRVQAPLLRARPVVFEVDNGDDLDMMIMVLIIIFWSIKQSQEQAPPQGARPFAAELCFPCPAPAPRSPKQWSR